VWALEAIVSLRDLLIVNTFAHTDHRLYIEVAVEVKELKRVAEEFEL
jgi:hypothetical protein